MRQMRVSDCCQAKAQEADMHKKKILPLREQYLKTSFGATAYSALLQHEVLSHAAHAVLSQQVFVESQDPQHSVFSAASAAFSELLQHAHEATANIAATTATDIKIFFIVR